MSSVLAGKEKGYGQRKRHYQIFSKVIDIAKESKDLLSTNIRFPEGEIDTIRRESLMGWEQS